MCSDVFSFLIRNLILQKFNNSFVTLSTCGDSDLILRTALLTPPSNSLFIFSPSKLRLHKHSNDFPFLRYRARGKLKFINFTSLVSSPSNDRSYVDMQQITLANKNNLASVSVKHMLGSFQHLLYLDILRCRISAARV